MASYSANIAPRFVRHALSRSSSDEFVLLFMLASSTALQLLKSKQYCGICKKIWHHSDGGNWVRQSTIFYKTFDALFHLKKEPHHLAF